MDPSADDSNLSSQLLQQTQARAEAEEHLRLCQERYRLVVEKASEGILVAQDGLLRFVNAAGCSILGYLEHELVDKPFTDFIYPEDRDMVSQRHKRRLAREQFESRYAFRILTKDRTVRWGEIDSVAITWEDRPAALFFLTDITERRVAEQSLKRSEEKFSKVFQASPDAIVISRLSDGCIIDVNEGFIRLSGYRREEALDSSAVSLGLWDSPGDRDIVIRTLKEDYRVRDLIFGFRTKAGLVKTGLYSAEIIVLGDEAHVLSMVRDITDLMESQKELIRSEQKYRSVLESSPDPIVVYNSEGCTVYVNPAFENVFGWSLPEVIGRHIDFVPEDEMLLARNTLKRLFQGESVPSFDTRRRTRDGRILDIHISAALLRDPDGLPTGNVVTLRDITQRKAAERALQQSEESKRLLLEGSPIGIGMIQDGVYVYANRTLGEMLGFDSTEDLLGRPALDFIAPEDRDIVRRRGKARALNLPAPAIYQVRALKRTGELFDVSMRPCRSEYMGRTALLTFVLDVTEENTLRAQLLQAQKMEAVGTLAGGIAHDFNNLLQVILGYSQLLLAKLHPGSIEHNAVSKIASASRGGADLIRQLMAFSRRASIRPEPLDLNFRIQEMADMLRRTIPRMIEIRLELGLGLPLIQADPVQIEQIIMNLVFNARDAMKEGGVLTIQTGTKYLDSDFCRDHPGSQVGHHVVMSVEDTGHGIRGELLHRIFEPFFTTKEVGQGTGLGLAMVYGIVKQNHGYISCSSQEGLGTTFTIYFAALPEGHVEKPLQTEATIPKGRGETILLVDDEQHLLELTAEFLTDRGFVVLTAPNGRDALEIYPRFVNEVRLVVLDLFMPEMGGHQCIPRLRTIKPDIKILVVTGQNSESSISNALALGATDFLPKPYEMMDLLRKVAEMLDSD